MTNTPKTNPTSVPDEESSSVKTSFSRTLVDELKRIWKVTQLGVAGLYKSQLPRMAAALAYRTIFSVIPVMAIGLLIFGSLVSDAQVESGVRRVLTFAGISQISSIDTTLNQEQDVVDQSSSDDIESQVIPSNEIDTETASEITAIEEELIVDPFAGADLEQVITDLINRVNSSIRNVPTGWIALTSGLVLLYAAMSMLIEIEKAFNQICGAPSGRGWLRRLMLYWTILTAGSLLLAATFLAGDAFTRWVISFAGQDSMFGAIMAGYGVSVLISTLLLLGAYLTIPNTRMQFRPVLAGAFFAAVLWELGKLGFTTYLHFSTGYAKFYGSVAILPLFMLWIYLTWLTVLFGMQASYALQHFSRLVDSKLKSLTDSGNKPAALIDPMIALLVAKEIQRAFDSGTVCTAEMVKHSSKLQLSQSIQLLDVLTEVGITNRIYAGDEFKGWSPTRPAEKIKLDDVLRAAYQIDGFRSSGAEDGIPGSIRRAAIEQCAQMSLADLESKSSKTP